MRLFRLFDLERCVLERSEISRPWCSPIQTGWKRFTPAALSPCFWTSSDAGSRSHADVFDLAAERVDAGLAFWGR